MNRTSSFNPGKYMPSALLLLYVNFIAFFTIIPAVSQTSDDFSGTVINTNLWTIVDPVGDATIDASGLTLSISVPGGVSHDMWTTGFNAPRVMQPINDTDFEVEAKFQSEVTQKYQIQGFFVENQNASAAIRFDVFSTGSEVRLFAASFLNDSADIKINAAIATGSEYYLRVGRIGDVWTLSYSYDGINWTVGGSFIEAMTVSKVGVFAGNSGNSPAFTGVIDYMFNNTSRIDPEDGGQFSLVTNTVGNGSITRRPQKSTYALGEVVELTAVPDSDWDFVGWGGDISGADNPAILTVSGDQTVTAEFVYNPPPPPLSTLASDDFSDSTLDANLWTFVNPRGDATLDASGLTLSMSVPGGVSHDMWTNGFNAPRVMQAVNDTDFEIETKFQSEINQRYQLQGVFVENQDTTAAIRFDVFSDGSGVRLFAASFFSGSADIKINTAIASGSEYYLRVGRIGDVWTLSYSYDGISWTVGGSFTEALAVDKAGVFVGNTGNSPAFTGIVDYVFNTASPIDPEDSLEFSLTTNTVGNGSIIRDPIRTTYLFNDVVNFTAVPEPNWDFAGWSGDISGTNDLESLTISGDHNVTAEFVYNPPPSTVISDDFYGSSLNQSIWTVTDPLGLGSAEVAGNQLKLYLPGEQPEYDLWTGKLNALRATENINNTDFEVEAKFLSKPRDRFQIQGIIVEQDSNNLLRFDFYSNGVNTYLFAANVTNGIADKEFNLIVPESSFYWLRVKRELNLWIVFYSLDGVTWTEGGRFTHELTANTAGVFAGNVSSQPFTAIVDYFFNTESPIANEDNGEGSITATVSGGGTISIDPEKASYLPGETVTLSMTPGLYWEFTGWSGDIVSTENPVSFQVSGDNAITANFFYNPPPTTTASDGFDGNTLDPMWAITDPLGDSSILVKGDNLSIDIPGGISHDMWTGELNAPRILQPVNNTDFEVEAKFLTPVQLRYHAQGILVQQDDLNFIRFDVYNDGSSVKLLGANFINGTGFVRLNIEIPESLSYKIRVRRNVNQWTVFYSNDGTTWIQAGTFNHELIVNTTGVFAANSGPASPLPFTSVVDYFINTEIPLVDENGNGGAIITSISGKGTVSRNIEQDLYALGESVELTAIPDPGWSFAGWSGDIGGTNVTESISISDDHVVQAIFIPTGLDAVINLWYGDNQQFGQWGIPQIQANIMGEIMIPEEIDYLSWYLNGEFQYYLNIGPNGTRLARLGDFNAEMLFDNMLEGANNISIVATAYDGTEYVRNTTVQYTSSNYWPDNYNIDWSTVSNINDVAQVVDGKWEIVPGGVRIVEPGYDRLINIGDILWSDYEVTVPVTVHSIDVTKTTGNAPAVGVLMRWDGHERDRNEQPGLLWYSMGSIAWYRWYDGREQFELHGNPTEGSTGDRTGASLPLGVRYVFKVRAETVDGQVGGNYSFKFWEDGQPEPEEFQIIKNSEFAGGLSNGSFLLVAHYADVTFGDVIVTPIERELEMLPEFSGGAVSVATRGRGTISKTPDQATYDGYETVTLTANPESGWEFVGWSGVGGVDLDINSVDAGLSAYKIDTPVATYYLEKIGAGLSGLLDQNGNDWIGFSPAIGSGSSGEYRGFPNAVFQQNGSSFFHALNGGTDPSTCTVTVLDPDLVSIEVVSGNGEWEGRYDFTPTHCTFTMTKAPVGGNYWVLYEGVPGGSFDSTDWWMTSDNSTKQFVTTPRSGDISAPEWMAFGDPNLNRSLVMYHHEDDSLPDDYYQADNAMTVFGFGRSGLSRHLQSVPQSFTIALVESDQHTLVGDAVENFRLDYAGVPLYETTESSVTITVTRDHNVQALFVPVNNTSPTVTAISDQQAAVDTTVGPLSITVGDAESPSSDLILTASSSNQSLIENGNIVFGGDDDIRTISLIPTSGQTGSTVITVYVDDGGLATTMSFNVTVQ